MAERAKRPKKGDLLGVGVDGGTRYLHYLGKHPEYGDAVRVLQTDSIPASATEWETVLNDGYVAFYPVITAVMQGLASVVGHHDARLEIPRGLRRPGARGKDGTVLTWLIERDGQESLSRVLNAIERALPIAVIWNHEMLCTRMRQGWRPEKEGP